MKNDTDLKEFALSEKALASVVGGVQLVTVTHAAQRQDGGTASFSSSTMNIRADRLAEFKDRLTKRGTLSQYTFSKPFEQ